MDARSERLSVTVVDGVADVRLAREGKLNAIDEAMIDAIVAIGEVLAAHGGVRAVVLSGEGPAFCAGLDFSVFRDMSAGQLTDGAAGGKRLAERTHGPANRFQQMCLVWRQLPWPVIAALHGPAFGGGLQIALAADVRIASPDAQLCVMEIEWGIVPDCGGTLFMRELTSDAIARELTFTGRIINGQEARALGLVNHVSQNCREEALAMARVIAGKNPEAVRAAKRLFNAAPYRGPEEMLMAESIEQDAVIGKPNQIEAVAARLAGRRPAFGD